MLTIDQQLNQFGLNENESLVYLEILKHGKIAISQVPKLVRINRTTVYSIVKKLIAMRLIEEDLAGKKNYLVARSPEVFIEKLDEEQTELDEKKKLASQIIKELKPLTSGVKYSIPKIRFVEEEDIEKHLYEMLPRWAENVAGIDKTIWGFQDHTFVENYRKWIEYQWSEWPEDINLKILTNKSYVENTMRDKYKQRQIKYWNKAEEFTSTIWVTGDFVTMISLRDKPNYLVEIHDPVMARNMRALFKGLWSEVR